MEIHEEYPRPLWISFAGADKEFVISLIRALKNFNKPDQLKIDPKAYLQVVDDNLDENRKNYPEIKYHLRLGDSIHDLVDLIASSPRRLLIISPTYITRQNCLMELACCLINENNLKLAIVLHKINNDVFSKKQSVEIEITTVDGKDEILKIEGTLSEILAEIYNKKLKSTMSVNFHIDELDESPQQLFDRKLNILRDCIYENSGQVNDTLIASIAGFVVDIDSRVKEKLIAESRNFSESIFTKWMSTKLAREYSEKYPGFDGGQFIKDLNSKKISEFVKAINEKSYVDPVPDDKAKSLRTLATYLSVLIINPLWAADMRLSSKDGLRLWLSSSTGPERIPVTFGRKLAAQVIHLAEPELQMNTSKKLDIPSAFEVKSLPVAYEQSEHGQEEINNQVADFIMQLLPSFCSDRKIIVDKIKNDAVNFSEDIYSELERRVLINEKNELLSMRFVADVTASGFSGHSKYHWESVAAEIKNVINVGLEKDQKIEIGMVFVSNRDDGNAIQFVSIGAAIRTIYKVITDLLIMAEN